MRINNEFGIGEIVFLKTDRDQYQRIITCILVYGEGDLVYELKCGTSMSQHFGHELSRDKDILITIN